MWYKKYKSIYIRYTICTHYALYCIYAYMYTANRYYVKPNLCFKIFYKLFCLKKKCLQVVFDTIPLCVIITLVYIHIDTENVGNIFRIQPYCSLFFLILKSIYEFELYVCYTTTLGTGFISLCWYFIHKFVT